MSPSLAGNIKITLLQYRRHSTGFCRCESYVDKSYKYLIIIIISYVDKSYKSIRHHSFDIPFVLKGDIS